MARQNPTRRRHTLQDVADSVGLSVNTVSRALNDMPGVSEVTRVRIKQEAERIGYVPNANARSLVLGSRKTIGVVVTNPSNPFYAEMISEIEWHCGEHGYTILLLLSDESVERERDVVAAAMRSGVDGLIAVPVQGRPSPWTGLQRAGLPLVLVSREVPDLDVEFVSTDNEAGAFATTDLVLSLGARDVVLLEEDLPISTIDHRIAGFRRALGAHGIDFQPDMIGAIPPRRSARAALPWQAEDAYRVSRDLLDRGRRPEAFVVGNDYFALGLYTALGEYGLSIPGDALVVGFGDYPFSRFLNPPLSTARLPAREVGRIAALSLLTQLESDEPVTPTRTLIKPQLVARASTQR
ncbi:LacI family DNA-binding transcriptional regulator [Microbacterium sp. OR16]|uniref:LacI family DNA-binding transcriptional regulator n=1 Tax=Microbacterium sp. OR16 TaxID=3095345 RepID=UPI0039B6AA3E